jgi:hypothetical protein
MPDEPAVVIMGVRLEDSSGAVLAKNFTTFTVRDGMQPRQETIARPSGTMRLVRIAPKRLADAKWSVKQWDVLGGLKVNGAGAGYFEYHLPWPDGLELGDVEMAGFRAEVSAKQLFGKDAKDAKKQEGDFMRGKGTHDPSLNPNSYPMTDERRYVSAVRVRIGGKVVGAFDLPDDPADHRGILSWHSQKRDKTLTEAGSYGYLISAEIPRQVLADAAEEGKIAVRLEADEALAGGLAVYGEQFGRYPLDPTVVFVLK